MDLSFLKSMAPRDALVTHVTPAGDAFAQDSGAAQIYIPRSLTERFPVNVGDVVHVKVVHNHPMHADRCPWKAYHVQVSQSAAVVSSPVSYGDDDAVVEDVPAREIDDDILDILEQAEMMSTADLSKKLGVASTTMRSILDRMHGQGKLIRADVYTSAAQNKASRSMWAAEDVFTPYLEHVRD